MVCLYSSIAWFQFRFKFWKTFAKFGWCDGGPVAIFFFPKQVCTLFVWGDLDREQISVFDLNSDEINRSVHYVHHILEQKKKSWK